MHSTSDQLACARSTRGEPRAGLLSAAWERILSNDPDDPVELRLHSFVLRPIPCVGHFFALPAETPSGGRRGENFTPSSRRAPGSSALQERRAPPARAGVRPAAFLREAALSSPARSPSSVDLATVEERRELRRIGANLNQVARHLNAGRDAEVLSVLRELNEWIVGRVSRPR